MAHVPHDADDSDGVGGVSSCRERTAGAWEPEAFADRILGAECVLGQNFVDDHDLFAACAVLAVEEASAEQRDAHDLQIIWGDAGGERVGQIVHGGDRGSGGVIQFVDALAHGDGIDEGDGLHSRHAARAIQNILPGGADFCRVGDGAGRKRHARDQHVYGLYARVESGEPQDRAREHPGGNEQHHGESDFGYHEAAVQAARAARKRARSGTQ